MAFFGRDYDRDYDAGYRSSGRNSGRSFWGTSGAPMRPHSDYGVEYGERHTPRGSYRFGFAGRGGMEPGRGYDAGYDRAYKSRWQTDYGDPFGDRERHTPMRIIRGEYGDYDRNFRSRGQVLNPREDNFPPMYRPYPQRPGRETGYDAGFGGSGGRSYRTYDRGYDRGWF